MATAIILIQLALVLALIFIGARVGGIGLGIYGMVGVFILVFVFGMKPGNLPIDVMLIIVSVITASAALQASGGLDYLVGVAAKFLRKHPDHITYFGPLTTWLFCLVAGTAHTSYSLLPIISEIATNSKIRPERPLTVATIAASLGITGSPVSAATAAIISNDLLGCEGVQLSTILIVCIPASFVAILVAAFVQNHVGKELVDDPVYQEKVADGTINPEEDSKLITSQICRLGLPLWCISCRAFWQCAFASSIIHGRWRIATSEHARDHRDCHDVDSSLDIAGGQGQGAGCRQGQCLCCRNECHGGHLWHSMDGRHLL